MTSPPPPRFGLRNLAAFAGLAAWAYYAAVSEVDLGLPGASARALIEGLSRQALWFVPVGALAALALPRPRSLFYHLVFGFLPAAALGAVVVALIAQAPAEAPWRVLENPTAPSLLPLLAPLAGMVAGALIGLVLARGIGSALMMVPVLLAVGVVLVAIAAVALLLLTDRVAIAEPARPPEDGALSARLHPGAGAAGISSLFQSALLLEDEELELAVSLPWEAPVLGERFFNFTATASPWVGATRFHAGLRALSVGGVGLPQSGVQLASDLLSRWLTGDPLAMGGAGITPVESVWMDGSRVLVRLAGEEAAEALAALAPSVSFYLDSLAGEADAIRARRSRLAAAVGRAFALARGRSPEEGEALEQNRAVLLALGAAGGHPSLLSLAGMPAAVEPARRLGESLGLALHGRSDWARHFLLSAGLTQVGEGGLTSAAGLLKERLDAAPGGSGFSFTDLLMDAAGARFGAAATRDESSARALQARLAEGVTDADLAPSPTGIADLTVPTAGEAAGAPPAPELLAMEREIARRVDALRLYRPPAPPDGGG